MEPCHPQLQQQLRSQGRFHRCGQYVWYRDWETTFNGANTTGATGNNTVFQITFNVVGTGTSALDLGYTAMAAATSFTNLLPLLTVNDGQVVAGNTVQYTLTYNAGVGGTLSGTTPQTVASGGSGTQVTAAPNTGITS